MRREICMNMTGENSLNELRNSLTGYLNDYHNSQTDNYKKGDIRYYYNKPYGIDINLEISRRSKFLMSIFLIIK